MTLDAGLSDAARHFLASYEAVSGSTDLDQMPRERREYAEAHAAGAARARERHSLELERGEVGGVECTRIHSTAAGTAGGRMLYLFGGAFMVGSPESDLPVIGALAEGCRVEVIAPHYRLAPEAPAPAAATDCAAVYRGIVESEPERLLVAGESAGGNLALLTCQTAIAAGLPSPAALALLSPAVDLRTDPELFEPTRTADPTLGHDRVLDVARAYVVDRDPTDPAISPLFGSMEALPPTIITTGSRDLLLSMALRLERKMRRAGVEVECRVWDGLWHVFEFYDDYPESAESLSEIAAFLNRSRGS